MKKIIAVIITAFLLISIHSNSVVAQLRIPSAQENTLFLSGSELNPFQLQGLDDSLRKGYAMEFLGFELGYFGGAAVTGGLFIAGFISAWGGNAYLGAPLLIGSAVTALATPILAGYLMHRFGSRYRPEGKFGAAILGSYIGMAISAGTVTLLNYGAASTEFRPLITLGTFTGLIAPGIIAVVWYNIFPKADSVSPALFSYNNGKFQPGIPSLSITPNPFSTGTCYTQINLVSVVF